MIPACRWGVYGFRPSFYRPRRVFAEGDQHRMVTRPHSRATSPTYFPNVLPRGTIYGAGCKLQQSSRHAPSCRPPSCVQPQSRRVVCTQKGKSPLSVAAATSCRWTERQRKAAKPPGHKEAGRKLVPCRVERGRSHVAQCVDRFCKLNTYYRPDPKIPTCVEDDTTSTCVASFLDKSQELRYRTL